MIRSSHQLANALFALPFAAAALLAGRLFRRRP